MKEFFAGNSIQKSQLFSLFSKLIFFANFNQDLTGKTVTLDIEQPSIIDNVKSKIQDKDKIQYKI